MVSNTTKHPPPTQQRMTHEIEMGKKGGSTYKTYKILSGLSRQYMLLNPDGFQHFYVKTTACCFYETTYYF
jgi:hypothetical protein